MGPLIIGLAAGALGWVLGSLGKMQQKPEDKKQEPAPPPADPRIDQIMQSQAKQEAMLNQLLQNQQLMMGGLMSGAFGAQQPQPGCPGPSFNASLSLNVQAPYGLLQCPAAMNALFGGAQSPGAFSGQLERLLCKLPAPACQ